MASDANNPDSLENDEAESSSSILNVHAVPFVPNVNAPEFVPSTSVNHQPPVESSAETAGATTDADQIHPG